MIENAASPKIQLHIMSIAEVEDSKSIRRPATSASVFRSSLKSPRKTTKSRKFSTTHSNYDSFSRSQSPELMNRSQSPVSKDLHLNLLKKGAFNASPEVSHQVVPALPSHAAQNSMYPLGAHFSGHYSKLKLKKRSHEPKMNISELIREDQSITKTTLSPRKEEVLSTVSSVSDNAAEIKPSSRVDKLEKVSESEDDLFSDEELNNTLLKLTDTDQASPVVLEHLQGINKLAIANGSEFAQLLFDKGAISILAPLLKTFHEDLKIQAIITTLLVSIYESVEKSHDIFHKLGVIPFLLKAASATSKAFIDEDDHQSANDLSIIQQRRGSAAFPTQRITFANSNHTQSPENKGSRRLSYANFGKLRKQSIGPVKEEEQTNLRTVSLETDSIVDGLLIKYYQPSFLEGFANADNENRMKTLKHILAQFEKLDKVLMASNSTSLDIEFDEALKKILDDTEEMMQAELVIFYEVDPNTGELILKTFNDTEEQMLGTRKTFPPGSGIAGFAVATKELINVTDPQNFPHYHSAIDNGGVDIKPEQILACPIFLKNEPVIAVVQLVNKLSENGVTQNFNDEDEYLLRLLSRTLTIIIANSRSIAKMTETRKKVQVLLETTKSLSSILDFDALIKKIMESAKELLNADRCTLFLKDAARKQLVAKIAGRDSIEEIRIKMDAGIAGSVLMSGESINIRDAYRDNRFNSDVDKQTGYVTKTILCVPIKNIDGDCIGVTQMINKKNGIFTEEDEKMLSSFSAQAAVALAKTELFQKTEEMRLYQHSILSSITSCVITLNDGMRMVSMNRPLVMNAIGVTEDVMRESPINRWIGQENQTLLNDVFSVFKHGQPIFVSEYEIKGKNSTFVNYQIVPLTGTSSNGLVLVFDDISSEKKAVMTLGRYMSPELAKQVLQDDNAQLGGTRKVVSILFSDIRSFTKISEKMEPHEVVELLNQHFTGCVNAIMEESGILDKFIGDAVMAVFGVPFGTPEDPINSCNAALRMMDAVRTLNEHRNAIGLKGISIGVGINTGLVLSGNIGSQKRMEYSCIGDTVNLASRVEGLTKKYGVDILITEHTFVETGDLFHVREIDSVIVQGKTKPVKLYELLGKKSTPLSDTTKKTIQLYSEGLQLYKKRNFDAAITKFQKGSVLYKDGPCTTLMERSAKYLIKPPDDDWEGVYTAEDK